MDDATSSLASIATSTLIAATGARAIPTPSGAHTLYYHGTNSSSPGQDPNDEGGECKLLGPFSVFVQIALGSLALLSLVYKRWRERPQRPVKIWAFDVSKQVFGSVMLHMLNLVMSMFSAGQLEIRSSYKPNPCSFYLLNLGIDTTLGIPILILLLRVLNYFASYTPLANPPESIESGNYGQPPRVTWWLKQSVVYFMGLLGMKICVFFLIELLPFIIKVGDWALRWTEGNAAVQIFFVMLLFPVIMNAIQYYIIDIFIKKPVSQYVVDDTIGDAVTDDDALRREALLAGLDESYATDSDDEEPGKSPTTASQPKATADALQESEHLLPEDQNPVPPYAPPSSSSSGDEHDQKATSTHH
ncbi:hypothetical protein E8E15_005344 [Penicillium rubens]|uniref:Pc22g08350 protein n=2 Tax=Penicillium chrysogenum species complex TaxID=254878 RepID=B6HSA0_PENRW|nr:uncharacterized protein N7525_005404 [Penicillium rubens]XP_056564492.1 uncharacterized protein N7489_011121 [Penicillium chrysogenum]CAP98123.1 Pc22g08350 [Penicillium rubens Wisconsin 54-1255]KAF3016347.1 hypothetical protein E8E15_005344 [Penicillium rubens]KAJ5043925.1 hypothetical protein NUH16_000719 [Penicillium rubens]KAJ5230413.1 hypothetical protein N7489_011121 [Penicillium chrysogenum]KAJ5264257.1 hypothetical protein N7505_008178 [Penicillium chrysogenum]